MDFLKRIFTGKRSQAPQTGKSSAPKSKRSVTTSKASPKQQATVAEPLPQKKSVKERTPTQQRQSGSWDGKNVSQAPVVTAKTFLQKFTSWFSKKPTSEVAVSTKNVAMQKRSVSNPTKETPPVQTQETTKPLPTITQASKPAPRSQKSPIKAIKPAEKLLKRTTILNEASLQNILKSINKLAAETPKNVSAKDAINQWNADTQQNFWEELGKNAHELTMTQLENIVNFSKLLKKRTLKNLPVRDKKFLIWSIRSSHPLQP